MGPLPETDQTQTPVSILLVDDRRENRLALQAILSSPEYRLVEASSGPEALRRLLDEEFAVLLIDVVMPEMNGLELAAAIRQRERTAAVPILFLTGQATDLDNVYRGYQVGAVDYLVKPLVPEMVRAKVAVFAELFRQRKRIEHQASLLLEAERARAALLVQASEARFRRLFEDSPISMQILSPDGRTLAVNRAWKELWEVSLETADQQVLGGVYNIFEDPQLHAKGIIPHVRGAFRGEGSAIPATAYDPAEVGKSGRTRWVRAFVYPIKHPDGSVREVVLMHGDVTEQQQAEITLRLLAETGELLATSLERSATLERISKLALKYVGGGCVIHTASGDGVIAEAVVAGADQGGLADGLRALFQASGAGTFGPRHVVRTGRLEFIRRVGDASNAAPESLELLQALKAKSYLCVPMTTRGRVWGTLTFISTTGYYSDEDLALAEELAERAGLALENASLFDTAQKAIRLRDEFLAIASHELRSPLSSLHLQLEILLRTARGRAPEAASAQVAGKLEVAVRQVDRLAKLINELLDVTRIAAGKLHLDLEEVNLASVGREMVSRLKEDAAKAGCEVRLQARDPVPGRWDRLRLEQLVTNLFSNALKYGAGKPVEISVTREGQAARLIVRDHGVGIAPEDAERIFQRFERATTDRKHAGLGLGLYIARQIVEAHGGTIRVQSQPGSGSAFTVELPLEPPAPSRNEGERGEEPPAAFVEEPLQQPPSGEGAEEEARA